MEIEKFFVLQNAPEEWHKLAYLFVALVLAFYSWKKYGIAPSGFLGWLCKISRITCIALFVFLIADPVWKTENKIKQNGKTLIAVDISASMSVSDLKDNKARIELAEELKEKSSKLKDVDISWWLLGDKAEKLEKEKLSAEKTFTNDLAICGKSKIATTFSSAILQDRPDSAILVSDGRITRGAKFEETQIKCKNIFALETGSDKVTPSLDILQVVGPETIPLDEQQPFIVKYAHRALKEKDTFLTVKVNGKETIRKKLSMKEKGNAMKVNEESLCNISSSVPGETKVDIEITNGKLKASYKLNLNAEMRKLKILMLANTPRYEMRYLKSALERGDRNTIIHAYLFDGGWHLWAHNDDKKVSAQPSLNTLELVKYDAIIIGDIGLDAFVSRDINNIDLAVRDSGAGIIWIPGRKGFAGEYNNSKLGKLLPVLLPSSEMINREYSKNKPMSVIQTEEAKMQGLLQKGKTEWIDLPYIYGRCPIQKVKEGSSVLMKTDKDEPIVVSRKRGRGYSIFIGTDETWRWRKNAEDTYLHRFYGQLLRYASIGRMKSNLPWEISVDSNFVNPRETVGVWLVSREGEGSGKLPKSITLKMKNEKEEKLIKLTGTKDAVFFTEIKAPYAGSWELSVVNGIEPEKVKKTILQVINESEEQKDLRVDTKALENLCGKKNVFKSVDELLKSLPNTSTEQVITKISRFLEWLWIIICLLLFTEWTIRRWKRLP